MPEKYHVNERFRDETHVIHGFPDGVKKDAEAAKLKTTAQQVIISRASLPNNNKVSDKNHHAGNEVADFPNEKIHHIAIFFIADNSQSRIKRSSSKSPVRENRYAG